MSRHLPFYLVVELDEKGGSKGTETSLILLLCMHDVCVCWWGTGAMMHVWRSEDNLVELFSFKGHPFSDGTRVRVSLYLLSHLTARKGTVKHLEHIRMTSALNIYFHFMYLFVCACVRVCAMCLCASLRRPEGALDSLKFESCLIRGCLGSELRFSGGVMSALNCYAAPPALDQSSTLKSF